jgi:hypothetical protein
MSRCCTCSTRTGVKRPKTPLDVLVDKVVDFPEGVHDYDDVLSIGEDEGGIVVCTSGGRWVDRNSRYGGTPVPMEWATQMTRVYVLGRQETGRRLQQSRR